MSAHERGLGRGLESLFRNAGDVVTSKEHARVPLSSLKPGKGQPRTHFDEVALDELASSIKSQGILQPILVRPVQGSAPQVYEIVAGERRWRAAELAGLTEVPVVIKDLSDNDVLAVALIENIQREDLNSLEEAFAIEKLRATLNIGQDALARRLGKSRSAIANALRLLQLPKNMLGSIQSGEISAGHARALLAITDAKAQKVLHDAILSQKLSVRDAETAVTYWKSHKKLPESVSGASDAPASEPKSSASRTKNSARTKSAGLLALQGHLRSRLHPKTTLSGTTEMGRVTVPYESPEQLASLLSQLGISHEDLTALQQGGTSGKA